jgi:hypothetical protein
MRRPAGSTPDRDGPPLIGEQHQMRIIGPAMDQAGTLGIADDLLKLRAVKADIAGDASALRHERGLVTLRR